MPGIPLHGVWLFPSKLLRASVNRTLSGFESEGLVDSCSESKTLIQKYAPDLITVLIK